jgi:hypothetical protein
MFGMSPLLLSACSGSALDFVESRTTRLNYAQAAGSNRLGPPAIEQELLILAKPPSAYVPDRPVSVPILERGPAANLLFCEALFATFAAPSAPTSFAPNGNSVGGFREILWFDQRFPEEIVDSHSLRQNHRQLLEYFDADRARDLAEKFDLFGSAGPWMLSVHPANSKSVLLDFSGYPEHDYRKALVEWKRDVIDNQVFWSSRSAKDWALSNIIAPFVNERRAGLLQIQIAGDRYRYPLDRR